MIYCSFLTAFTNFYYGEIGILRSMVNLLTSKKLFRGKFTVVKLGNICQSVKNYKSLMLSRNSTKFQMPIVVARLVPSTLG
jgi:hypothetical protein